MFLASGTTPKEALLGTQTTKGQESRSLRGEVQASCLVEAASELSIEGQKDQTLKEEAGRAFQAEGTAWEEGGR